MSWLLVLLVAVFGILSTTNLLNYVLIVLQPLDSHSVCPVVEPLAPDRFYIDNSTVLKILEDPEYRLWSVGNLAGAVQIDTHVVDNMPDVDEAPELWSQFAQFHSYLERTFPKVHQALELFKVNTYGLVFHWKGLDDSLKPLMLTAHQDVVPVQRDTLNFWTHPPFEGHYNGKYVFGRGSSDCKNSLIAVMEAVEILIGEGYVPTRGVVMAFGFDEEISGNYGAQNLGKFLEKKFGTNGIYAIIDEGPGLLKDPFTSQLVGAPATGEKGYLDLRVSLNMPGGHSSVPQDHGAIGIMGELAYNIEQDPFEPQLIEGNPILGYLQCLAVNSGDKMSKLQRKAILRAGFDKVANLKVVKALRKNKLTKYLIQTSQAVDMIVGGEKANALPEHVFMVANHRITVGQTVEYVKARFASRVRAIGEKYELNVSAFGTDVYTPSKALGLIKTELFSDAVLEYAPVSPSNDTVWEYLARTTRHVFENLVLQNSTDYPIITAPSIMPANTDTKFYWNLTKNIYRYLPMIINIFESNIHSVDEKIEFDGHLQLTAFYYEYIQNVDTAAADN